eukprot:6197366-Pleurochrysis_carterae.AAC.2
MSANPSGCAGGATTADANITAPASVAAATAAATTDAAAPTTAAAAIRERATALTASACASNSSWRSPGGTAHCRTSIPCWHVCEWYVSCTGNVSRGAHVEIISMAQPF